VNRVAQMLSSKGYYNNDLYVSAYSSPINANEFIPNASHITGQQIGYYYNPNNFVTVGVGGNPGIFWPSAWDLLTGAEAHSPYNAYIQVQ